MPCRKSNSVIQAVHRVSPLYATIRKWMSQKVYGKTFFSVSLCWPQCSLCLQKLVARRIKCVESKSDYVQKWLIPVAVKSKV
jgi:hypothetical protein